MSTHEAPGQPSAPTATTSEHNRRAQIDPADQSDFDDARRGFIGTIPQTELRGRFGNSVFDLGAMDFLDDAAGQASSAPCTVHPSLWRQARLDRINGLFEVTEGVYQVRGLDISVMTILEGNSGIIIIDPLTSPATAEAGLTLYRTHRGDRPVRAVVHTHSHTDHFGGVSGVTSAAEVRSGSVEIVAPAGFLDEAVSENIYAGAAMHRRAMFQFGVGLEPGPTGRVGTGLGPAAAIDMPSILAPTITVERTGERLTLDGVDLEFVMAPHTEAPAEFLIWLPDKRILDAAELATHTLHNLYAPRGAQIRDSRTWWRSIDRLIGDYGEDVEILIGQHHWPTWGNERVLRLLQDQRDLYKFLHDRVLHLANLGATIDELPDLVRVPEALSSPWHNRGYYGTIRHNARAVYAKYLGWYDSNPAHWDPLPPRERARKRVEYMGGAEAVLARARHDYADGQYRWVADVLSDLVFAQPNLTEARRLAADALEQLGYQSESAIWRNEYLRGALELRVGPPADGRAILGSADVIAQMTTEMLFDYLGIRLDAERAADLAGVVAWEVTRPTGEVDIVRMELRHGLLLYRLVDHQLEAATTVRLPRIVLADLASGRVTWAAVQAEGTATVDGDVRLVTALFEDLVTFPATFPVVEP